MRGLKYVVGFVKQWGLKGAISKKRTRHTDLRCCIYISLQKLFNITKTAPDLIIIKYSEE